MIVNEINSEFLSDTKGAQRERLVNGATPFPKGPGEASQFCEAKLPQDNSCRSVAAQLIWPWGLL